MFNFNGVMQKRQMMVFLLCWGGKNRKSRYLIKAKDKIKRASPWNLEGDGLVLK